MNNWRRSHWNTAHRITAQQCNPFAALFFWGVFLNWLPSIETLPYQHFGIFVVCFCFRSFICLRGECYNPYTLFSLVLEQMCRTYDGPNSNGTILFSFYFFVSSKSFFVVLLASFLVSRCRCYQLFLLSKLRKCWYFFFEIPFSIKFSNSKYF